MPFIYELTKPNTVLLYKTCVFELKPYIFFLYSYIKDAHTVHVLFKNGFILVLCNKINEFLTQTKCLIWHVSYNILLVFLFFFCSHQKNVVANKVISILKQCLQLASIHGVFSCMQHLYIQRKITEKFNFNYCVFFMSHTTFSF